MTASLYIHIPFCAKKCSYCDFYSIPIDSNSSDIDSYLKNLCSEIASKLAYYDVDYVPTIYIGGGTPSIIKAHRLSTLLSLLKTIIPNTPVEFSIEANPESIDENFILTAIKGGITRMSIGIQSFNNDVRAAVGRIGNAGLVHKKLALINAHEIAVSFDLMSGLPFQNKNVLRQDIETALSYKPAHISLYDLIIEEGTPLSRQLIAKEIHTGGAEAAEEFWLLGRDCLEQAGYAQYEVSNFALPGRECQHNIRYWRMQNWIGCGRSASSTIINDNTGEGIRCTDSEIENLDKTTVLKESIMMGFRFIDGIDEALFKKRFQNDISYYIPKTLAAWQKKHFIQPDKAALTKEGLLFLNKFVADCFSEIEP